MERHLRRAVRLAFILVGLLMAWFAFKPPGGEQLALWDKAQHFLSFGLLTALALAAFPKVRWWIVCVGVSAVGAAIELIQALPFIHRDAEVMDWVADTLAICCVVVVHGLSALRLSSRRQ